MSSPIPRIRMLIWLIPPYLASLYYSTPVVVWQPIPVVVWQPIPLLQRFSSEVLSWFQPCNTRYGESLYHHWRRAHTSWRCSGNFIFCLGFFRPFRRPVFEMKKKYWAVPAFIKIHLNITEFKFEFQFSFEFLVYRQVVCNSLGENIICN